MGFLLNFFKPSPDAKKQADRGKRGKFSVAHESKAPKESKSVSGPEKNDAPQPAATKSQHAHTDRQIALDIAALLPQVPRQYIHPDLPPGLKKEVRFSLVELLPSLAQGKATVPFSRIAGLSPEIFTEQHPTEPLEITLPLAQVVGQAGELPAHTGQLEESTARLGGNFSKLVVEKNAPHAQTPDAAIPSEPQPEIKTARPPAEPVDDEKILLRLSALLPHVPKNLLSGDIRPVEKNLRIPLPFHAIERQLGSGKVELYLSDFLNAMPEEFKNLLAVPANGGDKTKITIPLAEILLNLPGTTPLQPVETPPPKEIDSEIKTEQPVEVVANDTPEAPADTSEKPTAYQEPKPAAEPASEQPTPAEIPAAAELAVAATPIPQPAIAAAPVAEVEIFAALAEEKSAEPEQPLPQAETLRFVEPNPDPSRINLPAFLPPVPQLRSLAPPVLVATHQEAAPRQSEPEIQPQPTATAPQEQPFFSNGKLDPVKIADHVAEFDNITAVALNIAEEFRTAGVIPQNLNAQDVCTAARTLFQSVEIAAAPGRVRHLTLQHDAFSSTFFKQGDILLGVLHPHNPLPWETHGRLSALTEELARLR